MTERTPLARGAHARRRVDARGQEAVAWLAGRGLKVTTDPKLFRLMAETVTLERVQFAKIWHNAATVVREGGQRASWKAKLVVSLEGETVLEVQDGPRSTRAIASFVFEEDSYSIGVLEPSTRLEILLYDEIFQSSGVNPLLLRSTPIKDSPILRALVTLSMNAPFTLSDARSVAAEYMQRAVSELLIGLATETEASTLFPDGVPEQYQQIYREARRYIDRNAASQEMSAASVASALKIGMRQLQRSFSAYETSVITEIRRSRAKLAASLIRATEFKKAPIDDIAARAGFKSSDTMRSAVKHFVGETPRRIR